MEPGAGAVRHLYVHIPFCRARCAYCDFASEALVPRALETVTASYLNALETELAWSAPWRAQHLETVYVGGGTPTHLPFGALVALVRGLSGEGTATDGGPQSTGGSSTGGPATGSPAAAAAAGPAAAAQTPPAVGAEPGALELTVEANPEGLDGDKLQQLCDAGMTRLSLGVQSFDASLRRTLGRSVHDEALRRACGAVAECGLSNWNLDLIFGIPGQTWRQAEGDVLRAVAAGPAHISLYDLTYTPSYAARVARRLGPGAQARAQAFAERRYAKVVALLEQEGYRRYEVSNFARPGYECRHNMAYWRGWDYLGVGAAAVSTVGGLRWGNVSTAEEYVARWARYTAKRQREDKATWGSPSASTSALFSSSPASSAAPSLSPSAGTVERLTRHEHLFERAMLGLRTAEGVSREEVEIVLDNDRLRQLLAAGLVVERCGKLTLSAGGLNVSNAVLSAILVSPAAE